MTLVSMATYSIEKIIIIDQDLYNDQRFIQTILENFNVKIEYLGDVSELKEDQQNVLYVSNRFEGSVFEFLMHEKKPIISDVIVDYCIREQKVLPLPKHPLFNHAMKNFVICFSITDKKDTDLINQYLNWIRFMGGQSRKDMKTGKSFERTHLIESRTDSYNYNLAAIYDIPILYKEWIEHAWHNRHVDNFDANSKELLEKYKIKPFVNLKIALLNFDPADHDNLAAKIRENDGTVVTLEDEQCTHVVVRDHDNFDYLHFLDSISYNSQFVVAEGWLTVCLNLMNRQDEADYKLKLRNHDIFLASTPRKDDGGVGNHTLNSILLSPNYDQSIDDSSPCVDKGKLKKQAITQELYETEINYVTILKNIIKVFRDPLRNHDMPEQFPNEIELKTIFGCLPPIIDVHEQILVELEKVVSDWKVENEIGKIFQKHSQDFLTVYPQYVNYYEKTNETIELCKKKYPKFQAFIKVSETQPECKKQTFKELLINPIQRLPRIEMYLRALLNKTDDAHPDSKSLNEALNTIVSVITEINKKKKKTEGQIEMFDLLNEIEDCPATVLSANRSLISKCEVKLLSQKPCPDNTKIICKVEDLTFTLFLFTDLILFCKKRQLKRSNSMRGEQRGGAMSGLRKSKKLYKYIETIEFASIKCFFLEFGDIDEYPDLASNVIFVVIKYVNDHRSYPAYPFVLKEQENKGETFVDDMVKCCRDFASISLAIDDHEEDLVQQSLLKDVDFSYSKSIVRSMHRSKISFSKTKERLLRRTFSTRSSVNNMMSSVSMDNLSATISSPANRISRVFTNFNFLTPKQMAPLPRPVRKMSSIENMNEIDDNFSLPTTPAPRKKKCDEKLAD